ncbi:MAG: circularly permuted type 2 ATP-grasp protein [Planctomycetota bacterium]
MFFAAVSTEQQGTVINILRTATMIQESEWATSGGISTRQSSGSFFFGRTELALPRFRAIEKANSVTTPEDAVIPFEDAWWERLERGLLQRFEALHAFMEQLAVGKSLPLSLALSGNPVFTEMLRRLAPAISLTPRPRGRSLRASVVAAWTWFGATDLLLLPDGSPRVLSHNFSSPSGLERLPQLCHRTPADMALTIRNTLFPHGCDYSGEPAFLLEPPNPAADQSTNDFLASCLIAERVHRGQLRADRGSLFVLRNGHREHVRCLVRRIDDPFLDPNFFRPDSLIGLPGLVRCWASGETRLLHAPGTSLLNLQTVVRQVPQMIREFLGQHPLLETARLFEGHRPEELERILRHPRDYVFRRCDPAESVRPRIGRTASPGELTSLVSDLRQNPSGWCARPVLPANHGGQHLRVFASYTDRFRLLRAGILQPAQLDGMAPLLIPAETPLGLLQQPQEEDR